MRTYRIAKDSGTGGFMCPPGHWNHTYSLNEYSSPQGRVVQGISVIECALAEDAEVAPAIVATVQRIMANATLVESEAWVRNVYGYFKSMYAPESGDRNVSKAISDRTNALPPERHLATLYIREYFPDHKPRVDLILDPGKGFGNWPCDKCGNRVQYEAKFDAYAIVSTDIAPGQGVHWQYGTECPEGGKHTVDGVS